MSGEKKCFPPARHKHVHFECKNKVTWCKHFSHFFPSQFSLLFFTIASTWKGWKPTTFRPPERRKAVTPSPLSYLFSSSSSSSSSSSIATSAGRSESLSFSPQLPPHLTCSTVPRRIRMKDGCLIVRQDQLSLQVKKKMVNALVSSCEANYNVVYRAARQSCVVGKWSVFPRGERDMKLTSVSAMRVTQVWQACITSDADLHWHERSCTLPGHAHPSTPPPPSPFSFLLPRRQES